MCVRLVLAEPKGIKKGPFMKRVIVKSEFLSVVESQINQPEYADYRLVGPVSLMRTTKHQAYDNSASYSTSAEMNILRARQDTVVELFVAVLEKLD